MSAELTVALISGVVALLSIWLSATATQRNSVLQARLNNEIEQRREQASNESRIKEVVSRYRDPLLGAAFDLQSRIYNLVVGDMVHMIKSDDPEERSYAHNSTLFVIGQYLGWVEALRRGVLYLDLGDVDTSRKLVRLMESIRHSFSSRHGIEEPSFRIYRSEQRAIGELMLEGRVDQHSGNVLWHCKGYASFTAALDRDRTFASWFTRLGDDIDALATRPKASVERLVQVQHALIDLIDFLDEPPLRVPSDSRSKVEL